MGPLLAHCEEEAAQASSTCSLPLLVPVPVQCTTVGWAFPWGLRVRLYELLLRALFDALDEAEYIPDKEAYLRVVEVSGCVRSTVKWRLASGVPPATVSLC